MCANVNIALGGIDLFLYKKKPEIPADHKNRHFFTRFLLINGRHKLTQSYLFLKSIEENPTFSNLFNYSFVSNINVPQATKRFEWNV